MNKEFWVDTYIELKDLFANYDFQQFLGILMMLNMCFPLGVGLGIVTYHSLVIFTLGCMGIVMLATDYYIEGGSESLNKLKV